MKRSRDQRVDEPIPKRKKVMNNFDKNAVADLNEGKEDY